jgi:hypothetical protein
MAVTHLQAVHEVRELLTGALESGEATSTYDPLIRPVLVTLA